eukprot:CAMPEP_0198318892 /NCGR_PEP_ID=MMETSP1450-20131203/8142_1 /TAXON_ID=753684 ORGANISM="Madagascaria erythrocladiodes, Strain CCMP3234" /NCGR_SAMPLE_ID=MMETSP1450 /ASSEMBLY_ACC=CAM_ASM_001115 /LENGTH=178 /DNA_ID=CAMNT_0044022239 /DNA_START=270 /DNA_END=808 /DNA_ORIENTATION=+
MPQPNSLPPRPHTPSPAFTVTPTAQALAASTTYPTSPRRPGPDQARGRQRGAVGRPRGRPKSQQVKSEESKPRGILLERGSQGSRVPLRVQLLAGEEGERSLWLSEVGVESEGGALADNAVADSGYAGAAGEGFEEEGERGGGFFQVYDVEADLGVVDVAVSGEVWESADALGGGNAV